MQRPRLRPLSGRRLLAASLVALSLGPLAAVAEVPTTPAPVNRLLVFHWWSVPTETQALKALIDRFAAKYPGVSVSEQLVPGGGVNFKSLLATVTKLSAARSAPEGLQAHPGYASQPLVEGNLLNPIDAIWESEGLERVIPVVIRSMTNVDGHYYSVPLGVHRMNVVWYNKPLLDRHGISPASLTTWDAFFKAAERLKSGGVSSPIQVGKTWTVSVVFQGIVASLGMDVYEDWINGKITSADDPRMRQAFEILGRYLTYANADQASLEWHKALQPVVSGEAAFFIMGDWSDGEFRLAGKKYGKDYGAMPVPGTKGMYGVVIDTFTQMKGVTNVKNSDRWLRLVASREGQDAFNVLKGSIPARTDPDVIRYDLYQKSAILDFKNAKHVYPNGDEAVPSAYRTSLDEVLAAFAIDRDVKKATKDLAEASGKLAGKYTRIWWLK